MCAGDGRTSKIKGVFIVKKMICLVLGIAMLACMLFLLPACGNDNDGGGANNNVPTPTQAGENGGNNETNGSGTETPERFVLGITITLYRPMNFYEDGSDELTGFETDFANIVGEKLNLDVQFQVIEWGNKFIELEAGAIDAIWNGMTANVIDRVTERPRHEDVDFSYAYMINQQAVVIRAERADEFQSLDDLAGKTVAVESGSAGQSFAAGVIGDTGIMIELVSQMDTFIEVLAGSVDFLAVDVIKAEEIAGHGNFADLIIADIETASEFFAIGFRKGDPMIARVNAVIEELFADGTMRTLAEKYGLEDRVRLEKDAERIVQIG
jgi:polar amino acid transport system substrate-binding protein